MTHARGVQQPVHSVWTLDTIIVKDIVDIVIFGIFQVPTDSLASSFFLPLLWLLPSSFPRSKSWLSLQKQKMQIDYFFV